MFSSSSSNSDKIILKSSDGKTFEEDEAMAKHSEMTKHFFEDSFAASGPFLIPNVSNFLNTQGLVPLACEAIVDMLNRENSEQIRKMFKIKFDLTLDEEEKI
ncbi:hypothetical protein M9H77_03566 [Catharanthus roseus]|uniref:Uncharacterized protein n=1 Tax=Catharanthus roseus TaxID=4058 RepID=A0ACC0CC07_CATRO|nr:hypothetical protein M9H77_03566 [Catharanthus roseus]